MIYMSIYTAVHLHQQGEGIMDALDILATVFGLLGTICAIVFGYVAFKRNGKTDNEAEGKKDGVLMTEIGYIKSGVDDIKRKQEKQAEQHLEVVTRLVKVEQSVEQAHNKIDSIEEKLNKKGV